MPVLDQQRRFYQSGRLRLGTQVATGKTGRGGKAVMKPVKLDTWRFTTPSRPAINAAAERFGGTPQPWDNRGRKEWDLISETTEIMVTIPPRDAAITQWYEMWSGGGCQRRCDSVLERISRGPCLCPHADNPDDLDQVDTAARLRAEMAKQGKACGLKTRVSVIIPDLPGIGVWRLDTGGWYAAGELLDQAQMLEACRDRGYFLPARLWVDQRTEITGGQTRRYPVPVLELLATAREIFTGDLGERGLAAQLPPPPAAPLRAIAAAPEPAAPAAAAPAAAAPAPRTGQQIADDADRAVTRPEIEALAREADSAGVGDDLVCTDRAEEKYHELHDYLQNLWRGLPPEVLAA